MEGDETVIKWHSFKPNISAVRGILLQSGSEGCSDEDVIWTLTQQLPIHMYAIVISGADHRTIISQSSQCGESDSVP